MVLGVDWMKTLDEVSINFQTQKVKLIKGDKSWELEGIQSGAMELVHEGLMDKCVCQMAKGWVIYACSKEEASASEVQEGMKPEMEEPCQEFARIFEEPKGLPPRRSHDHQISLINGAEPVKAL